VEEVHLWRATGAQDAQKLSVGERRAKRRRRRNLGRFRYFDEQLGYPRWIGKSVLDFGGNQGDLLADPECRIPPEAYCCLDVLEEAVAEGRRMFPRARWVHYDRYNCSFNPQGIADLPIPDLGETFDLILAYSVFTHTTREEMHDLVAELRERLAPGGTLAFTFIDPHYQSWPRKFDGNNLMWRLCRTRDAAPETDVERLLVQSRGAQWCALVGGCELFIDENGSWRDDPERVMTYHVFYTAEFLQREFPDAVIRPPVNGEMQHCCLIRRAT